MHMLWIKIAGIILINICSVWLSFNKADGYKKNKRDLNCAQLVVNKFEQEIKCRNSTVYDALAAVVNDGRFDELSFLYRANQLCNEGEQFPTACNTALDEAKAQYNIDLINIMREFFNGLGKSDLEAQLKHCEYFNQQLIQNLKGATDELNKNYSFTIKIGVLAGALLSVMII